MLIDVDLISFTKLTEVTYRVVIAQLGEQLLNKREVVDSTPTEI